MSQEYLNIYNNLIKLTRNKNLYLNLINEDTFSDRLIILLFHFGFFLQFFKNDASKNDSQNLFDFVIKQIELSIREIGYGDVSINKKMKEYVNLFYLILEKIEIWDSLDKSKKTQLIADLINIEKDSHLLTEYFDKYREFLINNPLKNFRKDILKFNF